MLAPMRNTRHQNQAGQDPAQPARRAGKGKKAEASDQTRTDIIEVALKEFAEKGLAGARVDEIADRTATSKHMIYYHFGSKDGLYRAVLEEAYGRFRTAEASVDYDALSPCDALTALVEKSFDSHFESPDFVRIIMSENLVKGRHIDGVAGLDQRRAIVDLTARILDRGATCGIFRQSIDALQLHMTISALCFYYVANRFTFSHIFGVDLTSREMVERRRAEIVDSIMRICTL